MLLRLGAASLTAVKLLLVNMLSTSSVDTLLLQGRGHRKDQGRWQRWQCAPYIPGSPREDD